MSDDRKELELLAAALVEQGERRKGNPLYYYEEASAKHRAFHASQSLVRILAGGNRSGKTEANAADTGADLLGFKPWICRELGIPIDSKEPWRRPDNLPPEALCFNGAGVRIQIPNDVLLVSGLPMKRGIGEVFHPKFKKLMAPYIEREWAAHGGVPARVLLKNGSNLFYGSDEQDQMAFEGSNYSSIKIDEPIKKRHYTAIRRGAIDQFARITMTFTPLGPSAPWIFKDLYQEADRRKVEVFNVSIFDNRFLPPQAIEEFVNDPTLPELEKQARLYGRFMFLADRIYAEFNTDVHVIPPFKTPADWFHFMVVDPHSVRPWAVTYWALSPRGDFYCIKEWPESDFTRIRRDTRSPEAYSNLIRQLDADLPISLRILDPNYGPRADHVRGVFIPSLQSELARYGLHFDCQVNDDLEYGEAKVRQLLHYNTTAPVSALNRPRLYFFDHCHNAIRGMEFYSFPTKRGTEIPDELKRDETYKDFPDTVRYAAVKLADFGASDLFDPASYGDAADDASGLDGYDNE